MEMKIKWTLPALNDLHHEADFISQDNPEAAKSVFCKIQQSVESLKRFPDIGRVGREVGTRELVVKGLPYLIVYQITENFVEILTVFHTSRKLVL